MVSAVTLMKWLHQSLSCTNESVTSLRYSQKSISYINQAHQSNSRISIAISCINQSQQSNQSVMRWFEVEIWDQHEKLPWPHVKQTQNDVSTNQLHQSIISIIDMMIWSSDLRSAWKTTQETCLMWHKLNMMNQSINRITPINKWCDDLKLRFELSIKNYHRNTLHVTQTP